MFDPCLAAMADAVFVGLDNYAFIISDLDWQNSLTNTLLFALFSVSLETFFGLCIALLLNRHFKGRFIVRTAVLVPWAIPTVVSAKMWGWMLHDIYGVMNAILINLHVISTPLAWTADGKQLSSFR